MERSVKKKKLYKSRSVYSIFQGVNAVHGFGEEGMSDGSWCAYGVRFNGAYHQTDKMRTTRNTSDGWHHNDTPSR